MEKRFLIWLNVYIIAHLNQHHHAHGIVRQALHAVQPGFSERHLNFLVDLTLEKLGRRYRKFKQSICKWEPLSRFGVIVFLKVR